IGGIIVVDFIDMDSLEHRQALMNFLRERAALDRNKTKIVDMTPLGLVEITRHSR
ncbi:MAG: ribonuclease E/G, partial [Selenomonadaceae bacterium]|nr:ribonuclease E/G [Selenomonadaceae bacterium]